jgi:3-dehydroquinate synthase
VIADIDVLGTLPQRQILAGYAEVVKYGLVMEAGFFAWCEQNGRDLIDGKEKARVEAISRCCTLKAQIVREDEREAGRRALLNLGHTFGHALESSTGFNDTLLHGEAVGIGTLMAFDLSLALGLCPAADAARVRTHFTALSLPLTPPKKPYDIPRLVALMRQDKKAEKGQLTMVLVKGIGQGIIQKNAPEEQIQKIWEDVLQR